MKPTKNRAFCIGCQKQKMLFDNQSKADNFLKYNAKDILEKNEKAPVRSYYCTFCCGWHVTSNPSAVQGERLDERDKAFVQRIKLQKKSNEDLQAISKRVTEKIRCFDTELNLCDFDEAQDILDLLEFETDELRNSFFNLGEVNNILGKIYSAKERLSKKKKLFSLSEEEKKTWLDLKSPTREELKVIGSIKRINAMKILRSVFDNRENLISCEDSEIVMEIINNCRNYVQASTVGNGARQARARLNKELDEILKERSAIQANFNSIVDSSAESKVYVEPRIEIDEAGYKANILTIISKIEDISCLYEAEKYLECEDHIDVCYYILGEIGIEDDNTKLLRQILDNWRSKLE